MSQILDQLLSNLLEGKIVKVLIGLHWTAVVAEIEGRQQFGLASTLRVPHSHHEQPDVPQAGDLESLSGSALAALTKSEELTLAAVGVAAINALLPFYPEAWIDLNAEEVLAKHGRGKNVAVIGHFPFVDRLRSHVSRLHILEQHPQPGDLSAAAAAAILPQADVIAITGTTLINHTFDQLLEICSPQALIILVGPSTPLSPIIFDHGVDILCGSVVTAPHPVLNVIGQGGNFRQVRRAGVRTVTLARSEYNQDRVSG